jgi:hypothetical protein
MHQTPCIPNTPAGKLSHCHLLLLWLLQALAARLAGLKTPPAEPSLFAGLRVRMGICTGDVPSGTPIKSSALFQLAKGEAQNTLLTGCVAAFFCRLAWSMLP